jgi:hypothetical protein
MVLDLSGLGSREQVKNKVKNVLSKFTVMIWLTSQHFSPGITGIKSYLTHNEDSWE